ncbi:hypothetical protein FKW44_021262, partial [Caligus rogercresseyi]
MAGGSDSARSQEGSGHLAKDHEDTSEGAIHCFIDEDGNLCSYSFGSEILITSIQTERKRGWRRRLSTAATNPQLRCRMEKNP